MSKSHHDTLIHVVPKTFKANLNKQPGPGQTHSFHAMVDIEVEVDWKVELEAAVPQGINPFDLLLRFHVHRPTGKHSNAIATRTVRYDEKPAKVDYTHATIEDGPETQTVKVAIVV